MPTSYLKRNKPITNQKKKRERNKKRNVLFLKGVACLFLNMSDGLSSIECVFMVQAVSPYLMEPHLLELVVLILSQMFITTL